MRGKSVLLVGVMFLSALSSASAQTDNGLVGYWPFETVNGTTPDEAGDYDLTLNEMDGGNVVAGQVGNALHFAGDESGENEFLSITHDGSADLPLYSQGTYSVSLWVRGPSGQVDDRVFSEGSTDNNSPLLNIGTHFEGADGTVDIFIRDDTGNVIVGHQVSTGEAFDGTWHHLVWVDDNGNARLYIDGQLDETDFSYDPGTLTLNTLSVGGILRGGPCCLFEGDLDEVSVWNVALTSDQVSALASGTSPLDIEPAVPEILSQPGDTTAYSGAEVRLAVEVAGPGPFTYQWFKDDAPIDEETESALVISDIQSDAEGNYRVDISNPQGTVSSDSFTLEVIESNVSQAGLIAYWPLDSANGTTPDQQGDFDLTLNMMDAGNIVGGQVDSAFQFAGTEEEDEYLGRMHAEVGGLPIYDHDDHAYSITMWVQGDGVGQADRRVFSEGSSSSGTPLLNIGTDSDGETGVVDLFIRNDDGSNPVAHRKSTGIAFDGNWHHIAWVDNNGDAKLYIDGVLDDTDFSYPRGTLTPDISSVGAILRSDSCCWFNGAVDDVALWTEPLTSQQVQDLVNGTAPTAIEPDVPEVSLADLEGSLFTQGRVTLRTGSVSGPRPYTFQWLKDGEEIAGATGSELTLENLQLSDAGSYQVVVANAQGESTSDPVQVDVVERPAPPAELSIDVNDREANTEENTEPDFQPFVMDGSGILTGATTRAFGGVEISIVGSNEIGADDRKRDTPINEGDFTQERLLQDFIFSRELDGNEGLDIEIRYLKPNQFYQVTLWSFDTGSTGTRTSDWSANGQLVQEAYSFGGQTLPVSNDDYQFSFSAATDSNGTLLLEGRRRDDSVSTGGDPTFGVFVNALHLEETSAPLRITAVEPLAGAEINLTVETRFPEREHRVQMKSDLGQAEWMDIEATFSDVIDNLFDATVPVPAEPEAFYRVVSIPPQALFEDDFESGANGWTQGGDNSDWELGAPTSGPGSAHSGDNVWATALDGNYSLNANAWLRSPEIDLTGASQATLRFWHWYDIDPPVAGEMFHHISVNIKDAADPNGAPLVQLMQTGGPQTSWSQESFSLEDVVGQTIIVEFLLVSDDFIAEPLPGWYIDDVSVIPE